MSIVKTIMTNPGNIPEDKEWDMSTDAASDDNELKETAVATSDREAE